MTGTQALLSQLVADGVKHVFGNPGTTEQGFMDGLQDFEELQYILCLHEGVAVPIADAYARATRRPAFIQLHTAPGLGNGVGMLSKALRHRRPLVVYAGNADSRGLLAEPSLGGDLCAIAAPVSKWVAEAHHPHEVPQLLRRAMKIAAEPPMGPVFLSLPMDILDASAEMEIAPTVHTSWRWRPDDELLRRAAEMLVTARQPAILAGDGVALSDAQDALGELAELVGAPIYGGGLEINTPAGHRLNGGNFNAAARAGTDVVLMVGALEDAPLTYSPASPVPPGAKVIQVHPYMWELAKTYTPDLTIAADALQTAVELTEVVRSQLGADQVQENRRRADQIAERRRAEVERLRTEDANRREQVPIVATRMVEEVAAALPQNAAVFDEGITSSGGMDRYLPLKAGSYFRAGGGGIGSGLPGAVGIQLAMPDRPVLGFEGDGSAMYSITALWTAAHHKLPVTWVLCHNDTYRILKVNMGIHLGQGVRDRRFVEMDLTDPPLDFVKIAEGMGVQARRVERPEELGPALRDAIAHNGPSLVDVALDGSLPGR